ncbi:hypothetical protein MCBMB27_00316 [Methylobacterium phyllosphaerae]|uniref:DUF3606 domain-containing protein n=1 Tax=Methylobacterium phyllosphaerae TaxID=418223 RepID=A0AAE8L655_9HYPH|nr:DUF3606 domain-containing protein [Methylobacterium phyllosphaerae]APT29607.1 hypothetical protein MCBMB27_00316 [Methylobacterium phyllosphaerae]SFG78583.1 Protein of unknown function [Methylobacterium phyllosphaerae]
MTDNLNRREPEDKFKINVHEDWELDYWARKFGVTKEQIKDAVRRVGVQTKDVAKHLGKTWP